MNKETINAKCPFFSGNGKKNKSIVCRINEDTAYAYIKMEFDNTDKRKNYSDDYCNDFLYKNCPLFCAIVEESELLKQNTDKP